MIFGVLNSFYHQTSVYFELQALCVCFQFAERFLNCINNVVWLMCTLRYTCLILISDGENMLCAHITYAVQL